MSNDKVTSSIAGVSLPAGDTGEAEKLQARMQKRKVGNEKKQLLRVVAPIILRQKKVLQKLR